MYPDSKKNKFRSMKSFLISKVHDVGHTPYFQSDASSICPFDIGLEHSPLYEQVHLDPIHLSWSDARATRNFSFHVRFKKTEVSLRRDDTIKDFQALALLTRHQTDTPAAIYSGLPYLRVALAYQFLI